MLYNIDPGLKMISSYKRSSLLRRVTNYGGKKVNSVGIWFKGLGAFSFSPFKILRFNVQEFFNELSRSGSWETSTALSRNGTWQKLFLNFTIFKTCQAKFSWFRETFWSKFNIVFVWQNTTEQSAFLVRYCAYRGQCRKGFKMMKRHEKMLWSILKIVNKNKTI
jgi:hypothetical protein